MIKKKKHLQEAFCSCREQNKLEERRVARHEVAMGPPSEDARGHGGHLPARLFPSPLGHDHRWHEGSSHLQPPSAEPFQHSGFLEAHLLASAASRKDTSPGTAGGTALITATLRPPESPKLDPAASDGLFRRGLVLCWKVFLAWKEGDNVVSSPHGSSALPKSLLCNLPAAPGSDSWEGEPKNLFSQIP